MKYLYAIQSKAMMKILLSPTDRCDVEKNSYIDSEPINKDKATIYWNSKISEKSVSN